MEIVTTEVLPVDQSMGGNNTVYVHCESLNRRSHYGVCLFTIKAYKNDKLPDISDCKCQIGRGACVALGYREQELEAGRALFFKARQIKVKEVEDERPLYAVKDISEVTDPSFRRGWSQVGATVSKKREPQSYAPEIIRKPPVKKPPVKEVKKSTIFGTELSSFSDAIEAAVISETKKPNFSGMSLLERARARARASKGAI